MFNKFFYGGSAVAIDRSSCQKKRRKTKRIPQVQNLDQRVVFASVSFDAETGIVMFQEDPAGEVNNVIVNGPATNLTLQDQAGIDVTLICDNMAATTMASRYFRRPSIRGSNYESEKYNQCLRLAN